MSENQNPDPPTPADVEPAVSPPKQRLRSRLFTFRAMIAVTLAGLVIGAGTGTGITLLAGDSSDGPGGPGRHQRMERFDDGGRDGQRGPGGGANMTPPNSGNLPPGTSPRQQDDDTTPDQGSDSGNSSS